MSAPTAAPVSTPTTPGSGTLGPAGTGRPYVAVPRGPSSQSTLAIEWDFPVFETVEAPLDDEQTRSAPVRRALSLEDAVRYLAADDPRPLLVLRECLTCNGTDDALLTRQSDNERTMLLTRWFHCVKLSPAVTEEDHPFHALFAGEAPAHLFVSQIDGNGRVELQGDQSRTELWKTMNGAMAMAYEKVNDKGPKRPLGQLFKLLDKLDQVDTEILQVERRLEEEAEDDGLETRKARKLTAQLEEHRGDRSELLALVLKASKLKLRQVELAPESVPGATQGS